MKVKLQKCGYNPISTNKLNKIGFDYVALGHIHKRTEENKYNFIYPGSTISLGFDELGEHGMLDVEINKKNNNLINKNNIKINFIKLDKLTFEEINLNISEINSQEELIEKINKLKLNNNSFNKIILKGTKNIEINTMEICKLITNKNILKIEDQSEI